MTDSIISRQAVIDVLHGYFDGLLDTDTVCPKDIYGLIECIPSKQPTLYGYKIELLAYIARVMEKEGITAEQAVNSFDDLRMAVRLITEEALQKVEEVMK